MVLGTRAILRRPWTVVIVSALLSVPLLYVAGLVKVDTSLTDTFEADDPVAVSIRMMDERMDGIRPLEVLLVAEGEHRLEEHEVVTAIVDFERWAGERDGVLRATSFPDYLLSAWQRLGGFERPAVGETRTWPRPRSATCPCARPSRSTRCARALAGEPRPDGLLPDRGRLGGARGDSLRRHRRASVERPHRRDPGRGRAPLRPLGLTVSVTGEAYIGSRGIESVVSDLTSSLLLSTLVIFASLALLFRSLRAAAVAIPPNVIPLVATVAWMVARDIPLAAGTAVVFSIAIGISVDGSIHVLARLHEEEALGLSRDAALMRTARGTGRALTISALTLMLGFGSFLLSSFVPIQHFGELIAVAMGTSLLTTLILQPVLAKLFGGPDAKARRETKAVAPTTR
jgi:predicted RND superfamily exporter protein